MRTEVLKRLSLFFILSGLNCACHMHFALASSSIFLSLDAHAQPLGAVERKDGPHLACVISGT